MDLLSDSGKRGRVLIARHVGTDNPLAGLNEVDTTLLCGSLDLPDLKTYLAGLQGYGWLLWCGGALAVVILIALFCVTLRAALRHRKFCTTNIAFVLVVYPVVGWSSYISLVVPRASLISEAISQAAVMIGMYHFQRLVIADCGGSDEFLRRATDGVLETRVPPCCCWPCCFIPRPALNRRVLNYVRMLILQMPIVQTMVYITLLVLWAENVDLYTKNYIFLQPVIIVSLLTGIWSVTMTLQVAERVGEKPKPKFFALQLVLLVVKLQTGILKALAGWAELPCNPPLTPPVYLNLINHAVTIMEMLLLSLWAWRLYSVPPLKLSDNIQQVKVIGINEDSPNSASESKQLKDGIENRSFSSEHS